MKVPESLARLTAVELAAGVARRTLSAERVAREHLERIAEREPSVGAWVHLDPDHVLSQARALDQAAVRGPLHGVPVAIKDIIATADMPTEYGSPIYRHHRPAWDAACVTALRAAGAIIFGKTVTTEFATSYAGKTVNPHDATRTPGGSSSGSAAAVADFMVPLALGTQTGGSVIRPASFCGVVGYKPSFAAINRHGVKPLSESLDTVGVLARSVADAGLARVRDDGSTGLGETACRSKRHGSGCGEPRRGHRRRRKPLQHWRVRSVSSRNTEHGSRTSASLPSLRKRMRHITTSSISKWRARWRSKRANMRINSAQC